MERAGENKIKMDKETKKRFENTERKLNYLEKGYLTDVLKIKRALKKVCAYKSEVPLVEVGRENLASDIDNEIMPLFDKIVEKLK